MALDTTGQRPSLDSPPPPAPGATRRVPDTPMGAAMGAAPPVSSMTLPQAIIERAMLVEQVLQSLASVAPGLTPAVAQIIDLLRASVAGQLQGGQSPMGMGAPGTPGMGMMGAAPAPAPTGPGAVAPPMA